MIEEPVFTVSCDKCNKTIEVSAVELASDPPSWQPSEDDLENWEQGER